MSSARGGLAPTQDLDLDQTNRYVDEDDDDYQETSEDEEEEDDEDDLDATNLGTDIRNQLD